MNIYIIKCGEYHKIGVTSNIKKRMRNMQTNAPLPLELVYIKECDNAEELETYVHNKYFYKQTVGEWFKIKDGDIDEIKAIINGVTIKKRINQEQSNILIKRYKNLEWWGA